MFEDEIIDCYIDRAMERLSADEVIMAEISVQKEVEMLVREAMGYVPEETWRRIYAYVNRVEYDKRKSYEAGVIDGVRLAKWLQKIN